MSNHTFLSTRRNNMLRSIRTSMFAFVIVSVLVACSTGAAKDLSQESASAGNLVPSDTASSQPKGAGPAAVSRPGNVTSTARALAAGTRIDATVEDALSSRVNHSGDVVHAVIGADVKDSRGRVVVPAGSRVALSVDHIDPGNDQNQPDGRLSLVVTSVTIDGKVVPMAARLDPVAHQMVGRGITKDEAERIAAGTAIGAVAGQVIGKSTKGTVIGGAVGAVAGTAVAVRYAYRDVVVSPGTPITFTLTEKLVAAK